MRCAERRVTPQKSIEYVQSIIQSMGGDMMEFMCGKFDSVKACRSGYPQLMANFNEISLKVVNGTMKPQSGSPLRPMLQLFIDSQQAED